MKQLAEQVSLANKLERITISEFRKQPGEVLAQVALGKTFLVSKAGKPVAVLSKVPGAQLSVIVKRDGSVDYAL
jgi:antitoxin (DNA-binding transcriptional repressor) of toxin-antitoxin stability system